MRPVQITKIDITNGNRLEGHPNEAKVQVTMLLSYIPNDCGILSEATLEFYVPADGFTSEIRQLAAQTLLKILPPGCVDLEGTKWTICGLTEEDLACF